MTNYRHAKVAPQKQISLLQIVGALALVAVVSVGAKSLVNNAEASTIEVPVEMSSSSASCDADGIAAKLRNRTCLIEAQLD